MFDAVVKNVRFLQEDGNFHIGIKNKKFAAITANPIYGQKEWDAEGDIALPPFVEMHTHLDTVLTADNPASNASGTLLEGIQLWKERKKQLSVEDVIGRATAALKMLVQYGVLHVRAAVDISDPKLTALKALIEVRERYRHLLNIQIIAFPQDGLLSCKPNQERLVQAAEMGADAMSAVPHLEHTREDGIESLLYCFSIAKKYKKFVHIFCDETDDAQSRFLETVAGLTIKENMEGLVTASHANALAYYSDSYANKVVSLVKKANLNIVSCPLINCAMQGRFDSYPKGRGITRIKELNQANINVCIAHDDIQSPFYPFGRGNILQAAHMGAHLAHMTGKKEMYEVMKMISYNGAKAYGIEKEYGIEAGKQADFITLPAQNLPDLLTIQPKCRYVFKNGELMVNTQPAQTVLDLFSNNESSPIT